MTRDTSRNPAQLILRVASALPELSDPLELFSSVSEMPRSWPSHRGRNRLASEAVGGTGVADRFRRRASMRKKRMVRALRGAAAHLALLALLLQVIAVALCPCGLASAAPYAQTAVAHCHDVASDTHSDRGHGEVPAQGKHSPCPFCSAHCHAPLAFAPAIAGLKVFIAVSITPEHAAFIFPSPAHFPAGAPPRGPPADA